ncbi:hypothetical protein [Pedobacter sp. V48]|uniref:hypothetical protein n=1 Tax=Pedobacter sp. V48 TaxID=509635 RepID=UPI0003E5120A|nr:hypothetical protein [Pedobacter sp. V48]ETZ23846.1 hypothetical protein N824_15020 [Pedobacter sp. V48]
MSRNFTIALILIVTLGCKKDKKYSNDNITLYKWKRDLYRAQVQKELPAQFYSRDGEVAENQYAIFITSDFVVLTEYHKDKQQDSIFKASGQMQVYKYKKLERVSD